MLDITTLILGPVQTNVYLVGDPATREAVVVDPAWEGEEISAQAKRRGWQISALWVTHAHFDHIAGAGPLAVAFKPTPPAMLHSQDLPLWQMQGGAPIFGLCIPPVPEPKVFLHHGQTLKLGNYEFEVRHTPGHTPGHVIYSCANEKIAFVGDVIFQGSIGRTDLPGGDFETLLESIRTQVFNLPDDTRLFCGHGAETTVGEERQYNPFLR